MTGNLLLSLRGKGKMTSLFSKIASFHRSRAGNFAVQFAIAAVPLLGAAGFAVDYSRLVSMQGRIQNAADTAVLAAARKAQDLVAAGTPEAAALAQAEAWGRDFFDANTASFNLPADAGFTVGLSRNSGVISGNASWSGTLETTLLAAVGSKLTDIAVTATASTGSEQSFVEVHFVVDASASMGVGATASDHSIMASNIGCAFACHVPAGSAYWTNTHDAARAAGARLRIDVVKEAIGEMVDDLAAAGFSGSQLSLALHTFSNNVQTEYAPGTDIATFKSRLANIDTIAANGEGGTNFHQVMNQIETKVPNNGTGSSASSRKVFVVFVTDGVATNIAYDRYGPSGIEFEADPDFVPYAPQFNGSGAWAMQGFDPGVCNDLKNDKHATLMTLNVRYIIPTVGTDNDPRFSEIGSGLAADIGTHMRQCASDPSLALWADTPDEIHDAMDKIREQVTKTLRLRLAS